MCELQYEVRSICDYIQIAQYLAQNIARCKTNYSSSELTARKWYLLEMIFIVYTYNM